MKPLSKSLILISAFLIFLLSGTKAESQPPAIGPGPNTTQAGELSVFTLLVAVRAKTLDIVNEVNTQLQEAGESARVSIKEIKTFKPLRVPTRFDNRPNSMIVRVPFSVNIEVHVPVFGNRFIHIPIDMNVACDGWQTPVGNISVRAVPGPASIEGGSIVEDIIQVRGIIDAKVRNNFIQPSPSTVPPLIADTRCKNIGVTDFGTATVTDDAIHFDRPGTVRPIRPIIGTIGRFTPTVEITFNRLKRLPARDLHGNIVYREVEQISLNAFANYTQVQEILSMREGDDVALNLPPATLSASLFDKLVVIGNIEQSPNNPKDTGFRTSLRSQNFEPGSFVLTIPKFSIKPPDQFNRKPQLIRVNAYELSYTVKFKDLPVIQ